MKTAIKVLKVLVVLAAIAGVIYVIAAYGERIVAWSKALLARLRGEKEIFFDDDECFDDCYGDVVAADFEA